LGAALRFFAPFRALARMVRLRAEPRFLADRADFLAVDFLAFVAMDHLLESRQEDRPQQDSGELRRGRVAARRFSLYNERT